MKCHIIGLSLALAAVAPGFAQNCGTWVQRGPDAPALLTPRSGVRAAFDSTHNEVLVCGGSPSGGPRDRDSWGWNGVQWTQRSTIGPAVYQHAAAADTALGVVYSFAGAGDSGNCTTNGLARWNGAAWSAVPGPGPSPRLEHAMAFDSARHSLVLFGGASDCAGALVNGETWEWNGDWAVRALGGPSPRRSHMMAFDPVRGVTVLFGGYNGAGTVLGDTWEWNGQAWTLRAATGPGPRMAGVMDYHAGMQRTVLFGGYDGESLNAETWSWDGAHWRPVRTTGAPPARSGAALAFDPVRGTLLLFGGGGTTSYFNDFWEFSAVACCSADFDGDGDTGTDFDIQAFFACLGGNCCPTCGSADFDGDGDTGTDFDIQAFFRVLGGGNC